MLLLCMLMVAFLLIKWQEFARRLRDDVHLAELPQDRLLIIRAPGDEASAALLFFEFVSQISVRLYLVMYQRLERLRGLLERWNRRRGWLMVALVLGFPLFLAATFLSVALKSPIGVSAGIGFAVMWLTVMVPFFTLIGQTRIAAFPMEMLVGVMMFAMTLLLSIVLLPFGWQIALGNILLDVTAEATPPGSWLVNQIESSIAPAHTGAVERCGGQAGDPACDLMVRS